MRPAKEYRGGSSGIDGVGLVQEIGETVDGISLGDEDW
jgi:NADPH:quinone reductase-like Zn-dependent oxidoreductase